MKITIEVHEYEHMFPCNPNEGPFPAMICKNCGQFRPMFETISDMYCKPKKEKNAMVVQR